MASLATRRIGLVACVKEKAQEPAAAQDLYLSPLFRKSRIWAERHCDAWYVLSAKYGLLHPSTVVEPYEVTLNTMRRPLIIRWATEVHAQLQAEGLLTADSVFIWLAGAKYRTELSRMLTDFRQEDPLAHLKVGQRLQWLDRNL